MRRLGVVEATLEPLPLDADVRRESGRLSAAVAARGGTPRRRAVELAIAATAGVHRLPLVTLDRRDLVIIDDLLGVRGV